jgi:hypothetical protein
MGSRRQERHAEPGRLVEPASGGGKGYGDREKKEVRIRSNFHYYLELQKIRDFREPVPGNESKRLQRITV